MLAISILVLTLNVGRYDVLQESYDKREQERNAADSEKMVLRSTLKKR